MPFEQRGFLGAAGEAFIQKHRSEFKPWFDSIDALNEIAHVMLANIKINGADAQHLTCASLFLRVLAAFSSSVKLIELGLSQDAGTIVRSQVESTIYLTACSEDSKFVEEYHYSNEIFRLKLVNISLRGEEGALKCNEETKLKLLEIKSEIESLKKAGKVKELDVAAIAKKHGLQSIYNTAYRLLSNEHTHSSSRSLSKYFKFRTDGSVEAILWKPQTDDMESLVNAMCACLLKSFIVIKKVFAIPDSVTDPLDNKANEAVLKLNTVVR